MRVSVSTGPFQSIPDATQPFVDRLIGSQVGEHRIEARACEGRYGTLYRAQPIASGQPAMIQVLRTGLTGNDEVVKAANALHFPGIVTVTGFGELPDGRRYRVLERLEGESLDELLQRRGPLPARETAEIAARVAKVVEAAHAWALPHGCLGPSSVFVSGSEVKLFDFGLSKEPATAAQDLRGLGALLVTLLTGEDAPEGAFDLGSKALPPPLDRVVRQLLGDEMRDATEARLELERLVPQLSNTPLSERSRVPSPAAKPRRTLALIGAVALLAVGAAALLSRPSAQGTDLAVTPPAEDEATSTEEVGDETFEAPDPPSTEPAPNRTTPRPSRAPRPVPTVEALNAQLSRLEARLLQQARPGDDVAQALFVLNKQRLRLTGSPSVADRRDVAQQLAGWRRSYLH